MMTRGDLMTLCAAVKTEAEADALVDKLIEEAWQTDPKRPPHEFTEAVLENIGYMTGYMDAESAERILRLFRTVHPIFGATRPTAEQALEAGMRWGRATPEERDTMRHRPRVE